MTTSIYKYQRFEGGPELEDDTLALKLFAGPKASKAYPLPKDLLDFGRRVCGVADPKAVVERIAQSMAQTLAKCRTDRRIPAQLQHQMRLAWQPGLVMAKEVAVAQPRHIRGRPHSKAE